MALPDVHKQAQVHAECALGIRAPLSKEDLKMPHVRRDACINDVWWSAHKHNAICKLAHVHISFSYLALQSYCR